jgi:hypothetical protein
LEKKSERRGEATRRGREEPTTRAGKDDEPYNVDAMTRQDAREKEREDESGGGVQKGRNNKHELNLFIDLHLDRSLS